MLYPKVNISGWKNLLRKVATCSHSQLFFWRWETCLFHSVSVFFFFLKIGMAQESYDPQVGYFHTWADHVLVHGYIMAYIPFVGSLIKM